MLAQCRQVGSQRCMLVFYEQLTLEPAFWIRQIARFLNLTWEDGLLHHEEFINRPGGIILPKYMKETAEESRKKKP